MLDIFIAYNHFSLAVALAALAEGGKNLIQFQIFLRYKLSFLFD